MALGKLFNLSTPAFLSAFLSIIIPLARTVMDKASRQGARGGLVTLGNELGPSVWFRKEQTGSGAMCESVARREAGLGPAPAFDPRLESSTAGMQQGGR